MKTLRSLGLSVTLASLALACSPSDEASSTASENLNGVSAEGHELDAIAQIVTHETYGPDETSEFGIKLVDHCVGTLIAPDLVLTTKRCVVRNQGSTFLEQGEVFTVQFGPDSTAPIATGIPKRIFLCELDVGGAQKVGCDLAIIGLTEPVKGIAPIPVGMQQLSSLVGSAFTVAGYDGGPWPQKFERRTSTAQLIASEGPSLHAMFPTYEGMLAAMELVLPSPAWDAHFRRAYDAPLLQNYEARLGRSPVDCARVDQGGPILRMEDGHLAVYGVLTTVGQCQAVGNVVATFGPEAQRMLERARN